MIVRLTHIHKFDISRPLLKCTPVRLSVNYISVVQVESLNNDAFNYQHLPALAQDHSEQLDDSTERVT